MTSHGLPEGRPSAMSLSVGLLLVFSWMMRAQPASLAGPGPLLCPSPPRSLLLAGINYSGELVRREKACLSDNDGPLLLSKRDEWDVGRSSCLSPAPLAPSASFGPPPHLCQTTWDADGHRYPGFFCPRLSDTRRKPTALPPAGCRGFCCTQAEFEALNQVNLSALRPPPIFR